MNDEIEQLEDVCEDMGITLTCDRKPQYASKLEGGYNWENFQFEVSLLREGDVIWSGPFFMGLACVDSPSWLVTEITTKHGRRCIDAEKLLKNPAIDRTPLDGCRVEKPSAADVVCNLLLDGSAYFDALAFEEWCAELGYSSDSISALNMYRECDKIGRAMSKTFSPEELERLRAAEH